MEMLQRIQVHRLKEAQNTYLVNVGIFMTANLCHVGFYTEVLCVARD